MIRTRWAAGASLAILAMAGGASAQDAELALRELRAQNAAALQADILRQDMLATQREITARQDQANTAVVLRRLEDDRNPRPLSGGPVLQPSGAITPPDAGADSFAAQMDRMERLTQDALARSNARIRAVRPSSER